MELKYTLKLYIDNKRIPTKPYILNTLGNICAGFFEELKEIPEQRKIVIFFNEVNKLDTIATISSEDINIELKKFVQILMKKTIFGFISSLNDIPSTFPDSEVKIEYEKH